jgi:hypothetical protein
MTLTLDLPVELADRLREKAAEAGINPETCALQLLEGELSDKPLSEMDENELLLEAVRGLPESVWTRYHEFLQLRQRNGGLAEADQGAFCELNELVETTHARRVKYAAELASRRGVDLRVLMDQLGFPNYGRP